MATLTTVCEITWDTGVAYYSFDGIAAPTKFYEPYISNIRTIDREAPVTGAGYRISDLEIEFINWEQYFTKKKGGTAPGKYFYNRPIRLLYGDVASGLAAMTEIFRGRIQRWRSTEDGAFVISARDISYDRFRVCVHSAGKTLNTTTFPDLPVGVEPRLVPIIYGTNDVDSSVDLTTYDLGGPIPCYLIDTDAAGKWRYVVAAHVCKSVINIFVYGVRTAPANYTVTTASYGSVTMQVVDFTTDPRNTARSGELEVTAAVSGITDDGLSTGTLLTHPCDILEHLLKNYVNTTAAEIGATFASMKTLTSTYAIGLPIIDKDNSWEVIVDRWCGSILGSFYASRTGTFDVYIKTSAAPVASSTLYTHDGEIVEGSLHIDSNEEVLSEIHYDWLRIWPRDFFGTRSSLVISNQDVTLNADIPKHIDFWYVRDSTTATNVANAYADLLREEVEYVTMELMPDLADDIDLNTIVNISHWQGTGLAGYNDVIVRIYGISLSLTPTEKRVEVRMLKLFQSPNNSMIRPRLSGSMIRPQFGSIAQQIRPRILKNI